MCSSLYYYFFITMNYLYSSEYNSQYHAGSNSVTVGNQVKHLAQRSPWDLNQQPFGKAELLTAP